MADTVRVGLVGASVSGGSTRWGERAHVPALQALQDFQTKAVCTTQATSARASAEAFGAELAFHDVGEMAAHPEIDLIVVSVRAPDSVSFSGRLQSGAEATVNVIALAAARGSVRLSIVGPKGSLTLTTDPASGQGTSNVGPNYLILGDEAGAEEQLDPPESYRLVLRAHRQALSSTSLRPTPATPTPCRAATTLKSTSISRLVAIACSMRSSARTAKDAQFNCPN